MIHIPFTRRKRKEKNLKPIIVNIDKLATHDDIERINKELQNLKITPREKRELAIMQKWYSHTIAERKEIWNKLRPRQRNRLLDILGRQKGKQNGKSKK